MLLDCASFGCSSDTHNVVLQEKLHTMHATCIGSNERASLAKRAHEQHDPYTWPITQGIGINTCWRELAGDLPQAKLCCTQYFLAESRW